MQDTTAWVDADGTAFSLNVVADGALALQGVEGRFMPRIQLVEEEVPGQPGSRLREAKTLAREVALPILLSTATRDSGATLRTLVRQWLGRMNVDRGAGKLRVTASGGGVRELSCYYAGGLELVEGQGVGGKSYQKAVVVLRAVDPYWYDQSDTAVTYVLDTSTTATFFPIFPLTLLSSTVLSSTSISFTDNDIASIAAWPRWAITGPGTDIVLRNITTGKRIALDTVLTAGQGIDIDTRPGAKTVKQSVSGANLYGDLSTDSSLWPFVRGANAVTIEMSGATSASSVVLTYKKRYLGA